MRVRRPAPDAEVISSSHATIIVSDPGYLPTTRQMALAVSDTLNRYITSLAVSSSSAALRLPIIAREFARRVPPGDLQGRAESRAPFTELALAASARARLPELQYHLRWRQLRTIDSYVAGCLDSDGVAITQYGGALETLRRSQVTGTFSLLDYPIARLEVYGAILAEEAELRPDFRDTIVTRGSLVPRQREMDRIAQEVQLADRIIVGSEFAARSFSGIRSPGSVIVVPYGVDTGAFSPRSDARVPPEGPLRILFAGGLTQRKGIGYLLDAMQQLDPSRFHLTLAGPVIGTGAGLQRFRNRYRHLAGLRPIDMPHVYRDHDVLVLPSLCEGSALVVLEAMASGIPALVTPNAGADAVSDGVDGMIVPIRDVEAIHAALQRLDRDRDLLRRLGRKARERALTHDWNGFRVALRSTIEARS